MNKKNVESFPSEEVELSPRSLNKVNQNRHEVRSSIGSERNFLVVFHVFNVNIGSSILPIGQRWTSEHVKSNRLFFFSKCRVIL